MDVFFILRFVIKGIKKKKIRDDRYLKMQKKKKRFSEKIPVVNI